MHKLWGKEITFDIPYGENTRKVALVLIGMEVTRIFEEGGGGVDRVEVELINVYHFDHKMGVKYVVYFATYCENK